MHNGKNWQDGPAGRDEVVGNSLRRGLRPARLPQKTAAGVTEEQPSPIALS